MLGAQGWSHWLSLGYGLGARVACLLGSWIYIVIHDRWRLAWQNLLRRYIPVPGLGNGGRGSFSLLWIYGVPYRALPAWEFEGLGVTYAPRVDSLGR